MKDVSKKRKDRAKKVKDKKSRKPILLRNIKKLQEFEREFLGLEEK